MSVQAPRRDRAVSTWSLHRTLGRFVAADSAVRGGPFMPAPNAPPQHSLLDLLPEIAAHEYVTLQICHFHLESRDARYLDTIRAEMTRLGIRLDMLLIDDGDLTAANTEAQMAWYDQWLIAAEQLGADRARICAGRSAPTPGLLQTSGERLARLAEAHPNVRVVTENWLEMTPDADAVLSVLDAAGGRVGLLIDLGNWTGERKYADLAAIAPRAEACHAKCHFTARGPEVEDYQRSLEILAESGFDGPLALIYDGPNPDEWAGLDSEWAIVRRVFA